MTEIAEIPIEEEKEIAEEITINEIPQSEIEEKPKKEVVL